MSEDRQESERFQVSGETEQSASDDSDTEESGDPAATGWTWVNADENQAEQEASTDRRMWSEFDSQRKESVPIDDSLSHSKEDQKSKKARIPPPPQPISEKKQSSRQSSNIRDLQPLYLVRTMEFYFIWFLAALTFGAGDLISTGVVLANPVFGEANPFVRIILLEFGYWGFVGLKLAVFAVLIPIGVLGGVNRNKLTYYGPPLVAIVFGSGLTLWNLTKIFGM